MADVSPTPEPIVGGLSAPGRNESEPCGERGTGRESSERAGDAGTERDFSVMGDFGPSGVLGSRGASSSSSTAECEGTSMGDGLEMAWLLLVDGLPAGGEGGGTGKAFGIRIAF